MLPLLLSSCFTGVEGTSKINLSKKDQIATAPKAEDLYMADIEMASLGDWQPGHRFVVADEKFRLVTSGPGHSDISSGDTIEYVSAVAATGANGGERTIVTLRPFGKRGEEIIYSIEKPLDEARKSVNMTEMPMLIDLETVKAAERKLAGKTLWTRTAAWLDAEGSYKKGKKFDAVKVTDVAAGTSFFPIAITFEDRDGNAGKLLVNIGSGGNESRSFGKLFSLEDPRRLYKHITDEHWEAIQNEEVRIGMTKEECKLAIGNPSEVDTGHNYSNAVEVWQYSDGRVVWIIDGVVSRI